tara:strand:+ start:227 stop:646 length:420 start_codon:yes stop_codon:yes gene_type:complete
MNLEEEMPYKLLQLKKVKDKRGILTKIFTKSFINRNNIKEIEESYVISFAKKGTIRGEHFHKNTIEIFHVLQGECLFELVYEDEIKFLTLNSSSDQALMILPNIPHRIISKVDNSIVIAISSKEYNELSNDTFKYNFSK